jgi:branched-chain amino acid transport system substrate-binding protein
MRGDNLMGSRSRIVAVGAALALAAAACGSSSHSSAGSTSGGSSSTTGGSTGATVSGGSGSGSATKSAYQIGFITSQTGGASSSYANSIRGAEARIDALNATGGMDGHPLKLVNYDDQSTPSGNATAAQLLIQKGVLGVIDDTSFTFGGAAALTRAKIPVTGASIDGPEWGVSNNMFSVITPTETPVNGQMYTYTSLVNTFKLLGIKKLAQVGYQIPSVTQAANQTFALAAKVGISKCYNNNTISFGANDFTAVVLAIKSAGCDGVYVPMLLTSEIAIAQGLKSAGSTAKVVSPSVAYDQNVLDSPASLSALAGDYTAAEVDMTNPTAGSQTMLANLKQYTGYSSKIANLNTVFAYLGADVMIKGIQMAGSEPTPSKIIAALRTVKSYDGGGILPSPVTFQGYGTPAMFPATACGPLFQITTSGFQPANGGKPVCGTLASAQSSYAR